MLTKIKDDKIEIPRRSIFLWGYQWECTLYLSMSGFVCFKFAFTVSYKFTQIAVVWCLRSFYVDKPEHFSVSILIWAIQIVFDISVQTSYFRFSTLSYCLSRIMPSIFFQLSEQIIRLTHRYHQLRKGIISRSFSEKSIGGVDFVRPIWMTKPQYI